MSYFVGALLATSKTEDTLPCPRETSICLLRKLEPHQAPYHDWTLQKLCVRVDWTEVYHLSEQSKNDTILASSQQPQGYVEVLDISQLVFHLRHHVRCKKPTTHRILYFKITFRSSSNCFQISQEVLCPETVSDLVKSHGFDFNEIIASDAAISGRVTPRSFLANCRTYLLRKPNPEGS